MGKTALVLVFIFFLSCSAWAARPLSTDDAATVGQGAWEIEEGYELDQPKGGGASAGSLNTGIKYGVLDNLDLAVETAYALTGTTGFGDAIIKAKLGFNEEWAARIDYKLANANSAAGLGSGYTNYALTVIYSRNLTPATLHLNLGYTVVGQAGGAASDTNEWYYGAALEYPLSENSSLMGDVFGTASSSNTTNPLDLIIGANLSVNDVVALDGGIDLGLTGASSQYKVTAGITLAL